MNPIANLENLTKEEWLALRKNGVGASESAGLLGLSPWNTDLSIYVNKVEDVDHETSLAAEVGIELEPFLHRKFVAWLAKEEEVDPEIIELSFLPKKLYTHTKKDFIMCTPDDIFAHPERGLVGVEYKTAGEFQRDRWSDDEVPDEYYVQCQHCMLVTGLKEWYLAYLLGNRKFEVVLIQRNDELIKQIESAITTFWKEHVEKKIPPAPSGFPVDTMSLKLIYPEGQGEVELFELEATYDKLKDLEREKKQLESKIEAEKQQIMASMGESEVAILGEKENGRPKKATWKLGKDTPIQAHIRKASRQFRTF